MTKVINLFGGPCSGKSTTAAGLFYHMKLNHEHCEMVREYVKNWSWTGLPVSQYDQPYLFGKQVRYESMLYHRVDTIITDSPFVLSAFYDTYYSNTPSSLTAPALDFTNKAQLNGVKYLNFWLSPSEIYDGRGRYNDHLKAIEISNKMKEWLLSIGISFIEVPKENSVDFILDIIRAS